MALKLRTNTRRLYRFEVEAQVLEPFRRQLSLRTLSDFANTYWKNNKIEQPKPSVRFGQGAKSHDYFLSYYDPSDHSIELAEGQRDKITVLHELIHANGEDDHSAKFFGQQVIYLTHYCGVPYADLIDEAKNFGLRCYI